MQLEFVYLALFMVSATLLVLLLIRMGRNANDTIRELKREIRRDRRQQNRVQRQRYLESEILRRSARKINGKPLDVGWDNRRRRAHRDLHLGDLPDEDFTRNDHAWLGEFRTPWGWPGMKSNKRLASKRAPSPLSDRLSALARTLLQKKQTVSDESYQLKRAWCIRHLVEDRYGRVEIGPNMQEVEYVQPRLPRKFLEERETDQILAWKVQPEVDEKRLERHELYLVGEEAGNKNQKSGSAS